MFTMIKNGRVYVPQDRGLQDILLAWDKVAFLGPEISDLSGLPDLQIIEAEGKVVVPGFIDGHVHIAGGGGEGGPVTRTPPIKLTELIKGGITTVIGLLGVDGVTRSVADLLAKARSLEEEGLTSHIYTGAYEVPTRTLTGSVRSDLVLIDKILGVGEIAISDHRSAQPTWEMLTKLAAEARVGGMLGKKAGVVHLHLGEGKGKLGLLFEIAARTDIPAGQFIVTHVNRLSDLFKDAMIFLQKGGQLDLTAGINRENSSPDCLEVYQALKLLKKERADLKRVTVSSDGNGSLPQFDELGNLVRIEAGSVKVLWDDIRNAVHRQVLSLEEALGLITQNPASVLKLWPRKGGLIPGSDADVLILNRNLMIETVIARGRIMMRDGNVLVRDSY